MDDTSGTYFHFLMLHSQKSERLRRLDNRLGSFYQRREQSKVLVVWKLSCRLVLASKLKKKIVLELFSIGVKIQVRSRVDAMVVQSGDLWLKERLVAVKQMLKEWYQENILWKDFPIFAVNTYEGRRIYREESGQTFSSSDSLYGTVESYNGKHFIYVNSILADNYAEDDVDATLIHEILHLIHPNTSEKEIEEMTGMVCEHFNINPEKFLEQLLDTVQKRQV